MSPARMSDGFEVLPNVTVHYLGQNAPARSTSLGTVYENSETATDLVAQTLEQGSRHVVVLRNEDAPQRHRFRVNAKGPVTLLETDEGGVQIIDRTTGEELGYVRPPWAKDANGDDVRTHYEVRGSTILQVIEHQGNDTAYPVVADPSYDCGWVTCTLYFNRNETLLISAGGAPAGALCSAIPPPGTIICGVAVGVYSGTATYAYGNGGCLKVKHPVGHSVSWPDTHYGSPYCY